MEYNLNLNIKLYVSKLWNVLFNGCEKGVDVGMQWNRQLRVSSFLQPEQTLQSYENYDEDDDDDLTPVMMIFLRMTIHHHNH